MPAIVLPMATMGLAMVKTHSTAFLRAMDAMGLAIVLPMATMDAMGLAIFPCDDGRDGLGDGLRGERGSNFLFGIRVPCRKKRERTLNARARAPEGARAPAE